MPTVTAFLDFFAEHEVFLPKMYCNYTFFLLYTCLFLKCVLKQCKKAEKKKIHLTSKNGLDKVIGTFSKFRVYNFVLNL